MNDPLGQLGSDIAGVGLCLMAPPQQSLPGQLVCLQRFVRLVDKHAQRVDDKNAAQQTVGNKIENHAASRVADCSRNDNSEVI